MRSHCLERSALKRGDAALRVSKRIEMGTDRRLRIHAAAPSNMTPAAALALAEDDQCETSSSISVKP